MKGWLLSMAKHSEWATYGMMEAPFWRNDMSPEEYDREQEYFYRHLDDWKNGTYIPVWKQQTTSQ